MKLSLTVLVSLIFCLHLSVQNACSVVRNKDVAFVALSERYFALFEPTASQHAEFENTCIGNHNFERAIALVPVID